MLSGLRIGNFKAFSETQHVPIRPLTLIFGPNSSGKSSLIHGLLLAHEAMREGKLDVHRTELGGDSVDLGGFRQYVHRRDAGLQVEWALEISKDSFTDRLNELLPDVDRITLGITIGLGKFARSLLEGFEKLTPKAFWDVLIETAREKGDQSSAEKYEKEREGKRDFITFEDISKIEGEVHIETFWLDIGTNRLLSMSYRTEGHLRLDILDQEHGVMKYLVLSIIRNMTTTDEIDDKDREALTEAVDELVPKISSKVEKFFPIKLFKEESEIATSRQIALSTIGKERRKENLKEAIEYYLPGIIQEIVLGLSEIIENEISRLTYLGPLRSYPPRHIAFSQYHDPNWQAGGGYAWDTVLRNSRVRSAVNSWLGDNEKLSTSYELKVKNLLTINDIESKLNELISKGADKFHENYSEYTESDEDIFWQLEEILSEIPDQLKEFEQLFSNVPELVLFDKRTKTEVSHRDVGIGISQVLPVLVTAYASSNRIITIEQPEIHLHPALQAELGDVFINSALGEQKNTFIIETHSEHLILRILKRIRETTRGKNKKTPPINPDDVALLFVDVTPTGSIIQELRINEQGRLIDQCPGGFFEEDFEEIF